MSEEKFVKVLAMFVDYCAEKKAAQASDAEEIARVFLKNIAHLEAAFDEGQKLAFIAISKA